MLRNQLRAERPETLLTKSTVGERSMSKTPPDRRLWERRVTSYTAHIPERRSGKDRRKMGATSMVMGQGGTMDDDPAGADEQEMG
jgi:hypothetical protein